MSGTPEWNGLQNWPAVRAFFELSESAAEDIFSEESYDEEVSLEDVIDRINQYLERE